MASELLLFLSYSLILSKKEWEKEGCEKETWMWATKLSVERTYL